MIKAFFLQLQFLTRIPLPVTIAYDEKTFARGILFAPVIGLIIGSLQVGVYFLVGFLGYPLIAVFCAVIAEIVITGGLHLDGLADTCDAFFSYRKKEEMLKIMRDPRIGTNGTLALIIIIAMKIILLFSINRHVVCASLIAAPVLARMNILLAAFLAPYARKGRGMGRAVVGKTGFRERALGIAIAVVIAIIAFRFKALILIAVSLGFAAIATLYSKKRIGGITGDVFGAIIELSEGVLLFTVVIMG